MGLLRFPELAFLFAIVRRNYGVDFVHLSLACRMTIILVPAYQDCYNIDDAILMDSVSLLLWSTYRLVFGKSSIYHTITAVACLQTKMLVNWKIGTVIERPFARLLYTPGSSGSATFPTLAFTVNEALNATLFD